jgi:hypothetical protein
VPTLAKLFVYQATTLVFGVKLMKELEIKGVTVILYAMSFKLQNFEFKVN